MAAIFFTRARRVIDKASHFYIKMTADFSIRSVESVCLLF